MEIQIKPIIYIIVSLLLLWQLIKWLVPFLFNAFMSYIQGIVIEGESEFNTNKKVFDFFDYSKFEESKKTNKESYTEYIDFEEID